MHTFKKKSRYFSASLCLIASTMAFNAETNDGNIRIDLGEDEVSVAAENQKLSTVLVELGEQAGVDVTGADVIDRTFDGQVTGKDIEEVLNLLGVNSILIWDDASDERTLKEIILLSASEESSTFLPSGTTPAVAQPATQEAPQQPETTSAEPGDSGQQGNSGNANAAASTATESEAAVDGAPVEEDTSPGFGFSFDPGSETVNPQQ